MAQARYTVKQGDSLWRISERMLGDPMAWPRLFAYNNRSEVIQQTGRPILDPNLIYPNQILLLPVDTLAQRPPVGPPVQPQRPSPQGPVRPSPRQPPNRLLQPRNVQVPFAISYKLEDLPELVSHGPGFTATLKMTGSVTIELGEKVPLTYVLNRGQELSYKQQTDTALEQLLSETKVTWNRTSNALSFENAMVTKSVLPGGPTTAIAVAVASNKPVPSLKATVKFPTLKGRINGHSYVAVNFAVEIELAPDQPPGPVVQPAPAPATRTTEEITTWMFLAGAALLAGTLIADFLTAGASVADDPITVPAALAMMGIGVVAHEVPGVAPIEPY